ncbi:MAG: hypothetical protein JXB05_11755 [Myxococcaceae bacterium]|nr:hypothetical protein [Myxococcaceae bacterium]
MNLELLFAHADDHRPALPEGLPLESAANEPRPSQGEEPPHFWAPGGDPDDLSLQRWGVIAPEGARGDRLLALIQPLVELRQAGQRGAPVRVHRAPPNLHGAEAIAWKRRVLMREAVPRAEQPRYLLLLGDFDELSFELQRALASSAFVGRLAFRDDAGFEAYVAKVLRWERTPSPHVRGRAVFYTVHDGTAATLIGYNTLVAPTLSRCREQQGVGGFPAREILEIGDPIDWSPQRLLATARMEAPSLLFTLSHGLGMPRAGWSSRDAQRRLQGTMCLGSHQHLEPVDLARGPFLPGGIWFYFASFGAGTPAASAFHPWLSHLRAAGHDAGRLEATLASLPRESARPFVSALPQAALANPDGPLAVLGHVDLAWIHGFQEPDSSRGRVSHLLSVFRALIAGRRVGAGLGALLRAFTETDAELIQLYPFEGAGLGADGPPAVDPLRRAQLWMLRQDLAAYILLGDPATRLPLERRAGGTRGVPAGRTVRPRHGD